MWAITMKFGVVPICIVTTSCAYMEQLPLVTTIVIVNNSYKSENSEIFTIVTTSCE